MMKASCSEEANTNMINVSISEEDITIDALEARSRKRQEFLQSMQQVFVDRENHVRQDIIEPILMDTIIPAVEARTGYATFKGFNKCNSKAKISRRVLFKRRRARKYRALKECDSGSETSELTSDGEHDFDENGNNCLTAEEPKDVKLTRLKISRMRFEDLSPRLQENRRRIEELLAICASHPQPPVTSRDIVKPIAEDVISVAFFKFKLRAYKRLQEIQQENEAEETEESYESSDMESESEAEEEAQGEAQDVVQPLVETIVRNAYIKGRFFMVRKLMQSGQWDRYVEQEIHDVSSTSEEEESEYEAPSQSDEAMDLEEKMDYFFKNAELEEEAPEAQETLEEPLKRERSMQTDEGAPRLLITGVPRFYDNLKKVLDHLDKYGPLHELKVFVNSGGNVVLAKYASERSMLSALEGIHSSPFGKPWLAPFVSVNMVSENEASMQTTSVSSPIFDFICWLCEKHEKIEPNRNEYCDDCERVHDYGIGFCEYLIEQSSEDVYAEFKAARKVIKDRSNVETLKSLVLARESFRILCLDKDSFIDEETSDKMLTKIENDVTRQILQLSYKKELDANALAKVCADSEMVLGDYKKWLEIPESWNILASGEPFKEIIENAGDEKAAQKAAEELTNMRYDVLIDNGDFKLAYALVKACPTKKILSAHLENVVQEVKENPTSHGLIDQLFEILTMFPAEKEGNFDILVDIMKILPESRINEATQILLTCFEKKPSSGILRQIISHGNEESCKNAIDVLRKKGPLSSDLLRCLLEEVSGRHPGLFDFAFEVGMEVANWSSYDVLFSSSKSIDMTRRLLQRIATEAATAEDTCSGLQRTINLVREKWPTLLGQLASLLVNNFDPFSSSNLELVAKNGEESVIKKLLQRFEKEVGIVGQQRIYPRRIVKQLIDDALPRIPSLRQTLLAFFQRCFEADPAILQEDLLAIFQCENDFGKITAHIQEKTAFGQQYSSDLQSILNVLLKKADANAWKGLFLTCLDIAMKQFAEDPGNWSFLVLKYAKDGQVSKVVETLNDFIKNHSHKAANAEVFNVIQHLVSQSVNRWPTAMTKISDLVVTYFNNVRVFMPSRFEKLFCYHGFWLKNKDCLRNSLNELFSLMKRLIQMNQYHEWISLMEKTIDLAKDDNVLLNAVTTMVGQTKNFFREKSENIKSNQSDWKITDELMKLVPQCQTTKSRQNSCDGCLQLDQFLRCDVQKRNITVNGGLRKCLMRTLDYCISRSTLSQGGQRTTVAAALNLKFRQIDWNENQRLFNSRNCGAVVVEKQRAGDPQKAQKEKLLQEVDLRLYRISNRLTTCLIPALLARKPTTPSSNATPPSSTVTSIVGSSGRVPAATTSAMGSSVIRVVAPTTNVAVSKPTTPVVRHRLMPNEGAVPVLRLNPQQPTTTRLVVTEASTEGRMALKRESPNNSNVEDEETPAKKKKHDLITLD